MPVVRQMLNEIGKDVELLVIYKQKLRLSTIAIIAFLIIIIILMPTNTPATGHFFLV